MILFHRHKELKPTFAPWIWLALLLMFAYATPLNPVFALTGLGALLTLGGVILELNSPKVWADSQKWRGKNKLPWYRRPTEAMYQAHIWLVWPGVILLGIYALYAAYTLA